MNTWYDYLKTEYEKDYYKNLYDFVQQEYAAHTVYPPANQVMNALACTPLDSVKCVILGQDPYPGANQAMGLAFSVNKGIPIPRSLQNIYQELKTEYNYYIPNHGDLSEWTKQGVLLLNTTLTVQAGSPNSHKNHGWETYTNAIIRAVNEQNRPIVYLLWGKAAQAKAELITNPLHLVLKAPHPSPYSAATGFFGCGHFKKCNEFLMTCGIAPVNWQIHDI